MHAWRLHGCSHDGLNLSRRGGSAARLRFAPAAALADRFHISGLGKVTKWFGRIFQRRDGGAEPGTPRGSSSDLQGAGGPGAAAACPREPPLAWVRDGRRAPQIAELRRAGGGTGGESRCSESTVRGGASPCARVRERSSVSDTARSLAAEARRFSYKPAGPSRRLVLEDFSKEGGGDPVGAGPWLGGTSRGHHRAAAASRPPASSLFGRFSRPPRSGGPRTTAAPPPGPSSGRGRSNEPSIGPVAPSHALQRPPEHSRSTRSHVK